MPPHDAPQEPHDAGLEAIERRLAAATAELAALRREQQALAHGLAHDLHAPLRAIDSFAWLLARNAALDEGGADQVARVRENAARMARVLERLQAFIHAGIAPLLPVPVDVSLLAEWIGAELQEAAPARTLVLQVQPGLRAAGDERLLRTLLTQLLDNAMRFSPGDPRIALEGEDSADGLLLRVRDAGIGFDMAQAARLGEPFQRLHGEEEGAGCGLGLAIARRIAARHGGRLQLESAPGVGTTVLVFLPTPAAIADAAAP